MVSPRTRIPDLKPVFNLPRQKGEVKIPSDVVRIFSTLFWKGRDRKRRRTRTEFLLSGILSEGCENRPRLPQLDGLS
jgi:hypothetical protein